MEVSLTTLTSHFHKTPKTKILVTKHRSEAKTKRHILDLNALYYASWIDYLFPSEFAFYTLNYFHTKLHN